MKKILLFVVALLACVSVVGLISNINALKTDQLVQGTKSEVDEVKTLVEEFGQKLKMVNLLAPEESMAENMRNYYGKYVSKDLLTSWIFDPTRAPGRIVSSPWPDRIDIQSVEKISSNRYEVKGMIIEQTSVEAEHGGVAAERYITLFVKEIDGIWKIHGVILGDYKEMPII